MSHRAKRWVPVVVVLTLGVSSGPWARAQDKTATDPGDEAGFVRLFNGKDLSGWEGDLQVWSVKDGAIRCQSPEKGSRNWLVWRGGTLEDFELRLRFRFSAGNSGVQVRSKEVEKCMVRGYQVEVAPKEKMGLWHHSLSPAKERSHLATAGQKVVIAPDGKKTITTFGEPEQVQAAFKENQWNDLVVTARGPRLVQIINGVVFVELTDREKQYAARSGVLAFQDHGHGTVVEFKDIRLKTLR